MFPAIELMGRTIGTYAVVALLGAFLCGTIFCIIINRKGCDDNDAVIFLLFMVLGAMVGSRLLYAIVNHDYFRVLLAARNVDELLHGLKLLFGGSVFYGGLFGALFAGSIVMRVMRLDTQIYLDCLAPLLPLFHGIGRIGCFLAGCCYGIECEWGFIVKDNPFVFGVNGVTRFPVQLMEAACNFALSGWLFALLRGRWNCPKLNGLLIYIYLAAYACFRFLIEFLRGDAARGFVGLLSTSQFISVPLFAVSIIRLLLRLKTCRKQGMECLGLPQAES